MTAATVVSAATAMRVTRSAAIVIALAALFDPGFTVSRHDRALVAVVAGPAAADSALAVRVRASLAGDFEVVPAMLGSADALVIVGEAVPGAALEFARPAFGVEREARGRVTIERVATSRTSSPDAANAVDVTVRAKGSRGRVLRLGLFGDGALIDQASRTIVSDDERVDLTLSALPLGAGALPLRVTARLDEAPDSETVVADAVLDVVARRGSVLFYDARPSWMSTFVRRAVERDPRFAVTSRTVTSTNVSSSAGAPPLRLDDARVRAGYDVIVVGAPDALESREVSALDDFLRRRGGSVVLLLDSRGSGPYDRLTGAGEWSVRDAGAAVKLAANANHSGARDSLRATEFAWPVALPAGAIPVVGDSAARPVVWSAPVGAGQLVVSGAMDAWRFRDPSQSSFDAFWTGAIAAMVARALPPVAVTVRPSVARPGERVEVEVTLRDAALAAPGGAFTSVSAVLEARIEGSESPVRLLPGWSVGRLVATVRAPGAPGAVRVVVRAAGLEASAPLIVRADAASATGEGALEPWVSSRRGVVFPERDLKALGPALRAAIAPAARPVLWHPMRSPWWIIPFALLLSAEWWLRRRRALA